MSDIASFLALALAHTGTAEDSGDFDELDWDSASSVSDLYILMDAAVSYFCESMFATSRCLLSWG
jgi:hypothetical protein